MDAHGFWNILFGCIWIPAQVIYSFSENAERNSLVVVVFIGFCNKGKRLRNRDKATDAREAVPSLWAE